MPAPFAAAQQRPPELERRTVSITTTEGTWLSLDVSPDGKTLIFELLGDIYTMPVSGGQARTWIAGPAFQSQPRYSPDGSRVVYISDEDGSDNVWVAFADGTGARPVSQFARVQLLSPSFTSDGRSIFVTSVEAWGSRTAELRIVEETTGMSRRFVANTNGAAAPLVSSPAPGPYGAVQSLDGANLWYASVTPRQYGSRNGATSQVMHMAMRGGTTTPVALDGTPAFRPTPSRDGTRLAYGTVRDGRTGIKVRELATGVERWVAYDIDRHQLVGRASRDVLPGMAFSPDGRWLYAAYHGKIHRLGVLDGSDTDIPFSVDVSLQIVPTLRAPQRADTGAVVARRVQQPAVASNGSVAFSALGRIWVAEAKGRAPRRLTSAERPREFMPAWSPDGQWIAYVTWDEAGGAVWKRRADGRGDAVRLTSDAAQWVDVAWTPRGDSLVAIGSPLRSTLSVPPGALPPDATLRIFSANGGAARVVAPVGKGRHPHFVDGDGSRAWLSASPELVSIDLSNGRTLVEVTLETGSSPRPALPELRASPTGREVAVRNGPQLFRLPMNSSARIPRALDFPRATLVTSDDPSDWAWKGNGEGLAWTNGAELRESRSVDANTNATTTRALNVTASPALPAGSLVLRGATAITMRGDSVVPDADIVVSGGRFRAIGARGTVDVPKGAAIIDVRGKYVVPGFIDLHAHWGPSGELLQPESTNAFANFALGVTTIRDPQNTPEIFGLSDLVNADATPSPRIYSTGPGIMAATNFQSLDDALRALARYRDEYRTPYIKSYLPGNRRQRQLIVEACRILGLIPTTEGGADSKEDLTHAMDGFAGLEHAVSEAPIYDDVVQLLARSGITNTPTLVVSFGGALPVYRLLAEKRPHEDERINRWFPDGALYQRTSSRLLWFPPEDYNDRDVAAGGAAVLRAGGNIGLGGHGEVQGLSNHWEMQLLARGGMRPNEILQVATINGARALGLERDLGSLEAGKVADVVVLNANPLADIAAARSIAYVMKRGALYEAPSLDRVWPDPAPMTLPWSLKRDDAPATGRVDALVRRTMEEARIPGVAVAVVHHGEVLVSRGYGVAELEQRTPVTDETMFQSGSLGKQFTAAGILALVEDGRIDLDASVRRYLPETPAAWQPITIRHLLSHRSGIPDYTGDGFDYRRDYTDADLIAMSAALKLEFPAGARWNYSNTGYVLLGIIMGRVAGEPYYDFLRRRIFDPAGMPTIRVITEAAIVPHRAHGYNPVPGDGSMRRGSRRSSTPRRMDRCSCRCVT